MENLKEMIMNKMEESLMSVLKQTLLSVIEKNRKLLKPENPDEYKVRVEVVEEKELSVGISDEKLFIIRIIHKGTGIPKYCFRITIMKYNFFNHHEIEFLAAYQEEKEKFKPVIPFIIQEIKNIVPGIVITRKFEGEMKSQYSITIEL